jgi:heme A synthase
MNKVMAVVRTAFLFFIAGYTFFTTPMEVWGSATLAVTMDSLRRTNRAAWMAIAWIAFETALGWLSVRLRRKPAAATGSSGARPGAGAPQP